MQDAHNKIVSTRQCLNATMIIVLAILVAHFVDKVFYTFKESSTNINYFITYFTIVLKFLLMIMIMFVLFRIRYVVKNEPMLKFNSRIWKLHIITLAAYYSMWAFYEIWFTVSDDDDASDIYNIVLTVSTLVYNLTGIFLSILLFHMIDKMTMHVSEDYYDPVLKRHVPFFVYIAN